MGLIRKTTHSLPLSQWTRFVSHAFVQHSVRICGGGRKEREEVCGGGVDYFANEPRKEGEAAVRSQVNGRRYNTFLVAL